MNEQVNKLKRFLAFYQFLHIFKHMVITKTAKWELKETRRGINIFRRVAKTGSSQGTWITPGIYHNSLGAARAYIDGLPVGQFVGPGQIVKD